MSEPCVDCDDGVCAWTDCFNDADWRLNDVVVKRGHTHVHVGDVQLCSGHYNQAAHLGRLNLSWERVYQAIEQQT